MFSLPVFNFLSPVLLTYFLYTVVLSCLGIILFLEVNRNFKNHTIFCKDFPCLLFELFILLIKKISSVSSIHSKLVIQGNMLSSMLSVKLIFSGGRIALMYQWALILGTDCDWKEGFSSFSSAWKDVICFSLDHFFSTSVSQSKNILQKIKTFDIAEKGMKHREK